jgi:hypothetical protein
MHLPSFITMYEKEKKLPEIKVKKEDGQLSVV